MAYKRITKKEAQKRFWSLDKPIILVPNKRKPHSPFSEGALIFGRDYHSNLYENKEHAWESMYNNWSYYNCNYECGYYAHYYVEE